MKKILISTAIMVMIVFSAFAQDGGMKEMRMKIFPVRVFANELKLNDQQKDKIKEIIKKYKKSGIDIRAEINKNMFDKKTAMENGNFNKAREISDKISAKANEMEKNHITMIEEISQELTPEQREKSKEIMKKRKFMPPEDKEGMREEKHRHHDQ